MSAQALFAPGYSVVIYYPYNGNSPRRKITEDIRTFERRYYDLAHSFGLLRPGIGNPGMVTSTLRGVTRFT